MFCIPRDCFVTIVKGGIRWCGIEERKSVQRNVGPNRVHEKPKNFKKSIMKLLGYYKKLKPFYIIAIVLGIASSICSIMGPNRLADLTDTITEGLIRRNWFW